ncbi:hypothetical protein AB0M79_15045 [Polymorphospora sp. NPDC051019]|uniref:hypothetical protein n=1 Tax=Polymorphospora sp. NPDC051019 TaxID=3155725 RepID=UPI00343458E2
MNGTCQHVRGCDKPATYGIVISTYDTGQRMCGPHARDAVNDYARQGERNAWMRKV